MAGLVRVLLVVIGFFSSSTLTPSQSHQFLNQSFYVKIAPKHIFKVVELKMWWRSEAASEKDSSEYLITKNPRKENEYHNQLQKESSQEPRFDLVVGRCWASNLFRGRGGPFYSSRSITTDEAKGDFLQPVNLFLVESSLAWKNENKKLSFQLLLLTVHDPWCMSSALHSTPWATAIFTRSLLWWCKLCWMKTAVDSAGFWWNLTKACDHLQREEISQVAPHPSAARSYCFPSSALSRLLDCANSAALSLTWPVHISTHFCKASALVQVFATAPKHCWRKVTSTRPQSLTTGGGCGAWK